MSTFRTKAFFILFTIVGSAALCANLPEPAYAQANASDAALDGFVRDQTGGTIAAAKVIALHLATNEVAETTTDPHGYFRFPLLRVGEYELLVTAAGFAEYRQTGIQLSVGKQARLDIGLTVGAASETVNVEADASIVQTGQAAIEEVLNERAVRTLPIPSRNVYNFHLSGPGVKGIPSTGFGTTQYLVGGHNRTSWTIDGLDNTQRRGNRQIRLVISTPESVEEMQVVAGSYSAEFGRAAGGVINVVSRSGSNQYHGGGMGLHRPLDFSARPPLAASKPDASWWMIAGNLGGPIQRDRLFFFINDEYNPLTAPQPVTIAAAAAEVLGLPPEDLGNSPFGETFHTPSAKVNFRLSQRHSGFVRYNRFTNDQPGGGGGLQTIGRSLSFEDRMNGVGAQLATIVSPNLLNELRVGFNRRAEGRAPYRVGDPNGANINITGVAQFGINPLAGSESVEASTQIIDNLTWTRGRHTVKTGFDYQTTSYELVSALARTFTFGGLPAAGGRGAVTPLNQYLSTVSGAIDPATGRPFTYTQLQQELGDNAIARRFHFFNAFAQDEIRLTPSLSVNVGLRYELILFPELDPEAPHPLSREIHNDTLNVAPRVGFSWSPAGGRKTVIRGGYGMYYDSPSLNLALNGALLNGRRIRSYSVPGTDQRAPRFPDLLATDDPTFSTAPNITVIPEDFQIMVAQQASAAIERELWPNLSVNLQYSFWGHRFAPYTRDINLSAPVGELADGRPVFAGSAGRPDARFRQINLLESAGTSGYHGVDLTVRQRFSRGLQFSSTYSWARARSDSDMEGGPLMDPTSRARDRGPSPGDVRHTLVFQGIYTPAFSARGWRLMNGFELSSMTFYNSGFPINPQAGQDLNNDLVLNDRLPFRQRNAVQGPDFWQTDLRLARRVRLRGSQAVELIVESENLFNRLNANCSIAGCTGAVVNVDGAADFGRITASRPGRVVQLGARYSF